MTVAPAGIEIDARLGDARAGRLLVRGLEVPTPAFMPVGTLAAVKSLGQTRWSTSTAGDLSRPAMRPRAGSRAPEVAPTLHARGGSDVARTSHERA